MRYRILHRTAYRYSEPASLSQNQLCLRPRETETQKVVSSTLEVAPEPRYRRNRRDYFGNATESFMVQEPHTELVMTADSVVETSAPAVPDPEEGPPWTEAAGRLAERATPDTLAACQFVFDSPRVAVEKRLREFARVSFPADVPLLAGALDLIGRIYGQFTYDRGATTIDTPVAQVLETRRGVCQDFAHLAIGCLRSLGLAARYVSGYLETRPPPGKPKLVGSDASHAWVALFLPDHGWVGLDPTNNLIPGENHVTLAWGRDYGDVTPVKGVVMGGGVHTLSVAVDVTPLP